MTARPLDLARYRRGLELLDKAAALRPCPERLAVLFAEGEALDTDTEGEALRGGRMATKVPTSVRLTEAQRVELERLAEELSAARPDLVALGSGDALSSYAVLRLAVARGLMALRAELDGEERGEP